MNYTQKTIGEEELERTLLDEILNGKEPEDKERNLSDEEIQQMWAELERGREEIFKDLKEEPITDAAYREMEAGPYQPVYDPTTGQWTIAKEIEAFFGKDISRRMIRELENNMLMESHGQISKELYYEMKCLREGITPKKLSKKKTIKNEKSYESVSIQRERQPRDNYFMRIERGLILNESYRKIMCGPGGIIYQWLWAAIARKQWKDTTDYPLKKNFYDKGLLACTMSFRHIAEKCFLSKNTVKKHIEILQKEGIIEIKEFAPKGKKRGQNVYILGKWKKIDGEKNPLETFFVDQVYLSN